VEPEAMTTTPTQPHDHESLTPAQLDDDAIKRGADPVAVRALRLAPRHRKDGFPNAVLNPAAYEAELETLVPPQVPQPASPHDSVAPEPHEQGARNSQPAVHAADVGLPAVTVVRNHHGTLTKRATLNTDGALHIAPSASLTRGSFRTVPAPSLTDLTQIIGQLRASEAIMHGVAKNGALEGALATVQAAADGKAPGALTRTLADFGWPNGPGYLMLDFDLKDLPDHLRQRLNLSDDPVEGIRQLREVLLAAVPVLADLPALALPSASAMLYRADGMLLRGLTGVRMYIPVEHAADIPQLGNRLHARLILAGFGWSYVSKAGTLAGPRSLIDASVWSPERLDFIGGASCGQGVVQRRGELMMWNADSPAWLTLDLLPILSGTECARHQTIVAELRTAAKPEAERARAEYAEERRKAGHTTAISYSDSGEVQWLDGQHEILLADGWVSADEIIQNPERYHGKRCHDPLDPEGYGGDPRIGTIYTLNQTTGPAIHSFAHGGASFLLRASAAADFEKLPGEKTAIERANDEFALVVSRPRQVLWRREGRDAEFLPLDHWRTLMKARPWVGKKRYAEWWLSHPQRLLLEDVVVEPALPPCAIVTSAAGLVYNQWPGFATQASAEGSDNHILAYLLELVCAGNPEYLQWVLQWLAAMVQDPARLPGTALVLRGGVGVGKTTLTDIMRRLVGDRLSLVEDKPGRLVGVFNASLEGKVLVGMEEAFFAGDRSNHGALKHLITSGTLTVEQKYEKARAVRNMAHVIMTTNDHWAVPGSESERRFNVFDVSPSRQQDREYFGALRRELESGGAERFMHRLMYEIVIDWSAISRPLQTQALLDQQLESMDGLRRWLLERLRTGLLPGGGSTPRAEDVYASVRQSLTDRYELDRATPTRIGQFLKGVGATKVRPRIGGSRVYCYEFPPLSEARAAFARGLASTPEWEDIEEWQGDRIDGNAL
jgi:hypothetical protein